MHPIKKYYDLSNFLLCERQEADADLEAPQTAYTPRLIMAIDKPAAGMVKRCC